MRYKFSNARKWLQKHGRTKELRRIGSREKHAASYLNHTISSQIQKDIQKLIDQGYEVSVVIGNLKNIRSSFKGSRALKRRLHSWPFFQFQSFIKYKAEESGAEVKTINEKGTSATCYKCGSKGERPTQGLFICRCGKYNADLNAAINIAHRCSGEGISGKSEYSGVVSDRLSWLDQPDAHHFSGE
ncbi:MAG: transposase [Candidatus Aenigmarchaeota archaeon]|nr:transposase [Candidatus Aenigmarchaeota archaeon]